MKPMLLLLMMILERRKSRGAENADDEMMMSNHSDEHMHCYFHDVSINIRRKRGKNMKKSCITGMVCGDSLMKTRLYLYG